MPDPRCARHRGAAMGEVAERLNAPVLKTGVAFGSPWVRIPPSPFWFVDTHDEIPLTPLGFESS